MRLSKRMEPQLSSYRPRNCEFYAASSEPKRTEVYLIEHGRAITPESQRCLRGTKWLSGVKSGFRHRPVPLFGPGVTVWTLVNIFLAELLGTGTLLFLGCMSVVIGLDHLTICFAFGLVVATILQTIGHISVAHINPSISIAAVVLGKITAPMFFVYFVAQCIGATLGYGLLLAITPDVMQKATCCTIPNSVLSTSEAMASEFLATAILVFLLCGCWDKRNATRHDAMALKFGFAITALALAAGPYTGASMNPARTLGPAIWHGKWTQHWIYWLCPLTAGLSVSAFYRLIFDRDESDSYQLTAEQIPLNDTGKRQDSNVAANA